VNEAAADAAPPAASAALAATEHPHNPRLSLVARLTRTLVLWVGGIWLVCVLGIGGYMYGQVNSRLDGEMIESGRRMLDIAGHEYEEVLEHGQLLEATQVVLPTLPNIQPVTFQMVSARGEVLVRSASAPGTPLPVPLQAGFSDAGPWRVYTVAHPRFPTYLHLASPHSERSAALQNTVLGLALPMLAALPFIAWLLRRIARKELQALRQLEHEIAQRSGANLKALPLGGLPAELQAVGNNVNDLLERLTDALNVERALAAHAAHELRTPLATACLRLETAQAHGGDPALVQAALDALNVLRHRTERLLQLSRAESASTKNLKDVDLVQLAGTVAQDFWDLSAKQTRLELIVPPDDIPAARADLDGLAIALRNLVENALRYSGGAHLELEVMPPCTIAVRDFGPGVDAQRLQEIKDHHVRQVASRSGFGLGLSIVKTVVAKQGGVLELYSPPPGHTRGFEARIVLPPSLGSPAAA
jgi:two-component system, OmpR family, sensor kinase